MNRTFLGALLAFPLAAFAHHGWSEYDTGKPMIAVIACGRLLAYF